MVATTQATGSAAFGIAPVQQHGARAMVPTLLGSGQMSIPVAGRIRAGIKVLTRKAAEVPQACELYKRGVEMDKSFDAIEKEIVRAVPTLEHPLVPKNVPYFTARGCDFPNPETAREIMNKYAEDRGDGVHRLYRFPVVFPADAWQRVMPHELAAYTSGEKKFWSEYSADGSTRYCKMRQAVQLDGSGRRVVRLFGGRKEVHRDANDGVCDPEGCTEYQSRNCNLTGRFIFFIPGVRSLSAFDLPTNSFYAMRAAIEKFQTIAFMRGGRVSGFLDGQGTTFFLTKRLTEVSRIDEGGQPTRVSQWLIELEAPVDVTSLLRPGDEHEAIEARAQEAVLVLEGTRVQASDAVGSEPSTRVPAASGTGDGEARQPAARTGEQVQESVKRTEGQVGDGASRSAPAPKAGGAGTTARPAAQSAKGRGEAVEQAATADLAWLLDAAKALGVAGERYEAYAAKRWGPGWKLNAGGRKQALSDIGGFADDARGFQKKVDAELDVFK